MKKTLSQEKCSSRTPASIGPPAVAAAVTAPQMPIAELSLSFGNAWRSRASVFGMISAPAMPCRTRKTMTSSMLPDRPTASELSANPTTPVRNIARRPNRSPSQPAGISSTASASR